MQSFAEYNPMHFKHLGLRRTERLPRATKFHALHMLRIRLKSLFKQPITYFDLRATLTLEQQKNGDMWFITHFARERVTDAEDCSRNERLRYWLTTIRYRPELSYIQSVLYSLEAPHHAEQPVVDDYLVRWGYKLDVPPSFIELVHGTNGDSALYAIESLM